MLETPVVSNNERDFILKGILSIIKEVVTAQQFEIWFSCLRVSSVTSNRITFVTPNSFIREWLKSHYHDLFSSAVYKVLNSSREVHFSTEEEVFDKLSATSFPPEEFFAGKKPPEENYHVPLNKYYSFENFVVGPCNRLAHAAAFAVSETPGLAYNPLFIHGASGLGKTHLLHAINNVLSSKHKMKTLYVPCERFVNHYISTIRTNSWDSFRAFYRNIDALLIDDIQAFENSQESREEFFHTFNTLYNAKKQIVITSDCPPELIATLEDRLISRFKWGLLCSIDNTTRETRIAIAEKKASLWGINLSHEAASYLAENVTGSIRELEGAIARLSREEKITKNSITLDRMRKIVWELSGNKRYISIETVIKAVSERFNIRVSQLQSRCRTRSLALPRQIAMHLSRKLTKMSLMEIGGYLGGRDHSTVIHADEKITKMLKKDKNLSIILQKLESELQK
ncbi:MAG: chromosomal replication initiator protein DnaA [Candidatus Brocadia sp.]|uniref:Chromosomal replication initiator protein DnaA n=1 Tax=Candidatus Brocadia fulgida TaxID=380242 RepID=A0A0M2UT36_9BACT|nr:MAG: chromosomal replication initiator protein DnaA [Candidatus Brocadia fulgida]MCC6324121.1 chromosomal replication initiator protein DnaA [Candidatus Brocadia sp.]MCE7911719.1 chromosomal replication initiator protein DnaA [Candidatus Brocadia sp. AMX3]MBV6519062.1 Chromosomal replication initiator protein DnaA [Candidatus Brocadia fulgida]MDG5995700.1 chromosomal replication initiator protein DnaA [Candidatus Brocadia sp.]